jgi:hypothetical protein
VAQATAQGSKHPEPEPWAFMSLNDGPRRPGFGTAGPGWLTALGRAWHITRFSTLDALVGFAALDALARFAALDTFARFPAVNALAGFPTLDTLERLDGLDVLNRLPVPGVLSPGVPLL